MDISFYTAAVGAQHQQLRLNVHANNVANINNYGFHPRRTSFSNLMTSLVPGIDEDLARGVGAKLESTELLTGGQKLEETDRALDYAIEGRGFFALLDPRTGEYSYTRSGAFILSSFITWEAAETPEEPVEAEEGVEEEVPPEEGEEPVEEEEAAQPEQEPVTHWYVSDGYGRFVLGTDGRPVEITDQEAQVVNGTPLAIGIYDFANYNGMLSAENNRLIPVEKNGQVGLGSGRLIQGYLELSNADLGYEFAKVIETQRTFTYLLKMVQTSDEITSTGNNLR